MTSLPPRAETFSFILKVLLLSLLISLLIKYVAPNLSISSNSWQVTLIIILPALILVLLFTYRTFQNFKNL